MYHMYHGLHYCAMVEKLMPYAINEMPYAINEMDGTYPHSLVPLLILLFIYLKKLHSIGSDRLELSKRF